MPWGLHGGSPKKSGEDLAMSQSPVAVALMPLALGAVGAHLLMAELVPDVEGEYVTPADICMAFLFPMALVLIAALPI